MNSFYLLDMTDLWMFHIRTLKGLHYVVNQQIRTINICSYM
jgi:hypothetical protein